MSFSKTTFTPGVLPAFDATEANRITQALDDLYNKVAFKVYRNAAFSVADGTQLQFDSAEYDPDGLYKTAAGATQWMFVCPRTGLWVFTAQYALQGSPGALDTYFAVRGYKNGPTGTDYEGQRHVNRGTNTLLPAATFYVPMTAGDTFEVRVTCGAAIPASPLNVGPNPMYTWFGGHQVRAT